MKILKKNIEILAMLLFIMAMLLIVFLIGNISIIDSIKIIGYNFGLVLIGFTIAYLVFRKYRTNFVFLFSLSFPIGLAIENIVFLTLSVLSLRILLPPTLIIGSVFSFLLLFSMFYKDNIRFDISRFNLLSISILIIILFAFAVIWYFPQTTLPHINQRVNINQDIIWELGNIKEAIHHWPIQNPRVSGAPFYYHYFVYLHMASQSIVANVQPEIIIFRTYIPILFISLIFLSFSLAQQFWPDDYKKCVASIYILFLTGSLSFIPDKQIFMNSFFECLFLSSTFLMGLLMFSAFVIIYLDQSKKKINIFKNALLCLLFWVGIGTKGPVGIILLCGIWGVVSINIFRKEIRKGVDLFLPVIISLIFVCGYLMLFIGNRSPVAVRPISVMFYSPFYRVINKIIQVNTDMKIYILPSIFIVFLIGYFSYRILSIKYLWRAIKNWKELHTSKLFVFIVILISIILWFLLDFSGLSQDYFLFYGYYILSIISGGICYNVLKHGLKLSKIVLVLVLLLSFPSVGMFIPKGINVVLSGKHLKYEKFGGISGGEVELFYKLEEFSEPNDVIFGNAFYLDEKKSLSRWFYGSALSGRRFFIEGWEYANEHSIDTHERENIVFAVLTGKEKIEVLKKNNVKYIVLLNNHDYLKSNIYDQKSVIVKIYENSSGKIYKVNI